MAFLHENLRFKSILETIAEQKQIDINMVEKDYWIMHSLWGLQNLKFDFYLKGEPLCRKVLMPSQDSLKIWM